MIDNPNRKEVSTKKGNARVALPTIKCLRVSFSHEVEEYDSNKERVISIIVIVCKM